MNYGYCSQKKTQFSVTLTAFFCFCLVFFFFAVAFKSAPSYHLISSNSACLVAPRAFPTHNRTDLGFDDFIDPLSLYLQVCTWFSAITSAVLAVLNGYRAWSIISQLKRRGDPETGSVLLRRGRQFGSSHFFLDESFSVRSLTVDRRTSNIV